MCLGQFAARATHAQTRPDAPRPNILVILLDDMGWSDLGCYGGEVRTPNIDSLAAGGLRFTEFYNTSRCCPTRASLLSGLYPHQAGIGKMTFDEGPDKPGYRGVLQPTCVTIAEVLRTSGYRTAMVGKWHVSLTQTIGKHNSPEQLDWLNHRAYFDRDFADPATYPVGRGFEEHYGVIWGVVDYFDPFSLVHNTTPIREVPKGYYITDALTDHAIEYINKYTADGEPLFLYAAYTAPHWPLHALPQDIDKYKDTYTPGFDATRQARYKRQVEMGLIDPKRAPLSERMWPDKDIDDLKHPDFEARRMAVHAAMIDRVDQGVGRIIATLKQRGLFDNTLIMVLSDNGACAEQPSRFGPGFDRNGGLRNGEPVHYVKNDADEVMMPGPENVYTGIGPRWANVGNTPFRWWKAEEYHGGVMTPLIVHWPAGLKVKPGSITHQPGHVIDIMATCVDLAGATYPTRYKDHDITPMEGRSLRPIFEGEQRAGHEAIYFEHFGGASIRMGDWKLVRHNGKPWELYNLAEDLTETHDVAASQAERVASMKAKWEQWAKRANVK
ncbi:MAG: sulfatase-like hydrolase/transferase [Phycisphaera sp.]|nr:sulfatase-like hydrolase/transferase [Phycisphaera sp.]